MRTHPMSAEEARTFERGESVASTVTVRTLLACGCEPYRDVFTYRRWKAQGYQVQRGEKAIRVPLVREIAEHDTETGAETGRTRRMLGRSALFCRHQVQPIEGNSCGS